jgi:lysophospholipase L1-like esterase
MKMPAGGQAIVALGDSVTDGTLSTLNGDDRWPDVLARSPWGSVLPLP